MFMPPGTTCEADHPNPDVGYCGDVAVDFVKDDKGRDRPVCLFHRELWHIQRSVAEHTIHAGEQ